MIAPCNIESVLNPVKCLKKMNKYKRVIIVQYTLLGVLLNGNLNQNNLRKRKRWVVVPLCSNFSYFEFPCYREPYIRLENLWKCSTLCDIKHEESVNKTEFQDGVCRFFACPEGPGCNHRLANIDLSSHLSLKP